MGGVKRAPRKTAVKKASAAKVSLPKAVPAKKATARSAAGTSALRTAAGTRLSRAYEAKLLAEAESGFDVTELSPRVAVGRPSLTGRAGNSRRIDLRVDDETFAAVRDRAAREHRPVSEVVRDALRRYVDAS